MNNTIYDISTIVVTYKCNYLDLEKTLKSLVLQENVNQQIIVCDDGSPEFDIRKVELIFDDLGFKDYIIVNNKINQGTILNIYSGIQHVKCNLVKIISPKDYIYSKETYATVVSKFKTLGFDLYVGNAVYYNSDNEFKVFNVSNPKKKYSSGLLKNRIVSKQLLIYKDWFLGATAFYELDYLKYSLETLSSQQIKFCEDLSTAIFALNNKKIYFDDSYLVWYEYGYGISTNSSFYSLLVKDYDHFFMEYLDKNYNQKTASKAVKFYKLSKQNTLTAKLKKVFLMPGLVFYKLANRINHKKKEASMDFYNIVNGVDSKNER